MNKSKTDDISAWLARRAQELTIDIEDARTMGKGTEIYCDDPDCFNSIDCACSRVNFNDCYIGRCYCPGDSTPRWFVYESGHDCRCL